MTLSRIHLTLARTADHPDGDPDHGYDIIAPLKKDGGLDVKAWQRHRDDCTVHRFAPREDDERGHLVHGRRGWVFSYRPGEEDDEPIFRLDTHRFREGDYISITEHDGETRPFRVTSVRPLR